METETADTDMSGLGAHQTSEAEATAAEELATARATAEAAAKAAEDAEK
jgi:hypothetical protein